MGNRRRAEFESNWREGSSYLGQGKPLRWRETFMTTYKQPFTFYKWRNYSSGYGTHLPAFGNDSTAHGGGLFLLYKRVETPPALISNGGSAFPRGTPRKVTKRKISQSFKLLSLIKLYYVQTVRYMYNSEANTEINIVDRDTWNFEVTAQWYTLLTEVYETSTIGYMNFNLHCIG